IELLEVTVSEIKLSLSFSLNDHTESYATVLTEREGSVAMMMKRAEKESDINKLTGRRDDISLQDIVTTAVTAREAEEEEEEDVIIRVILLQSVNITVSVFN
ncbi:hypothetical protein BDFG_09469, partial [Blastomyces dermatitidis ATCC 26199]